MRGFIKILFGLILLLLALILLPASMFSQTAGAVAVTGHLGDATGFPAPGTYLHAQLTNCGNNQPRIVGSFGIVKQTADFTADSTGLLSGYVVPNDVINCGGVTGGTRYLVSFITNNVPQGPGLCFQILSSQNPFNFDTATPCTVVTPPPPPTPPYDGVFHNLNVTGVLSGTSAVFTGTIQAHEFLLDNTPTPCPLGQFVISLNPDFSVNCSAAGAPVTSVFGRTGAVVSQTGDYTCSQVTGCPATLYYQTIYASASPVPQQPQLRFSSKFGITTSSPQTIIDLSYSGNSTIAASVNGEFIPGDLVTTDVFGNFVDSGTAALGTDYYFHFTGCTLVVTGNSINCRATQNFSSVTPVVPTQPDTNYFLDCVTVTGEDWGSSTGINVYTTSSFTYVSNVDRYNGVSATVSPTVTCHLHHP